MRSNEVIIVGGGPAGSACARLIAKARPDWQVALVEREAMPRARACGEYLAPHGFDVLKRKRLADAAARSAHQVGELRITGPRGGLRATLNAGYVVRREIFEGVMRAAAAEVAAVHAGCVVGSCMRDQNGWRLRVSDGLGCRELNCRLLIGADGRHSQVRRAAGLHRASTNRRWGLACRAHGIADVHAVELHLGALGQIAIAPHGDGESTVNLLLAPSREPLLRGIGAERLLRYALATTPTLVNRTKQAVLGKVIGAGPLAGRALARIGDGVALIGDAAGGADPFCGEGMSLALRSAELLAEHVAGLDLRRAPTRRELMDYASAHARAIAPAWRRSAALAALLEYGRLSAAVVANIGSFSLARRLIPGALKVERVADF